MIQKTEPLAIYALLALIFFGGKFFVIPTAIIYSIYQYPKFKDWVKNKINKFREKI
jgi:hypothetical protein